MNYFIDYFFIPDMLGFILVLWAIQPLFLVLQTVSGMDFSWMGLKLDQSLTEHCHKFCTAFTQNIFQAEQIVAQRFHAYIGVPCPSMDDLPRYTRLSVSSIARSFHQDNPHKFLRVMIVLDFYLSPEESSYFRHLSDYSLLLLVQQTVSQSHNLIFFLSIKWE